MTTNWTAEQKSVYQDFKSEGFAMSVRTPGSAGTYSETTMSYSGGTAAVDVATYGIKSRYEKQEIDGTIIQRNDTRLLFPAYGLADVTPSKQILIGGVSQNVLNINAVSPGNVPLLYEAQIRG